MAAVPAWTPDSSLFDAEGMVADWGGLRIHLKGRAQVISTGARAPRSSCPQARDGGRSVRAPWRTAPRDRPRLRGGTPLSPATPPTAPRSSSLWRYGDDEALDQG